MRTHICHRWNAVLVPTLISKLLSAYFVFSKQEIINFRLHKVVYICIPLLDVAFIRVLSCDLLIRMIWMYHQGACFWTSPPPVCWYYVTSLRNFTAHWPLLPPVAWKSNYSLHHFRAPTLKSPRKDMHPNLKTICLQWKCTLYHKMVTFLQTWPG